MREHLTAMLKPATCHAALLACLLLGVVACSAEEESPTPDYLTAVLSQDLSVGPQRIAFIVLDQTESVSKSPKPRSPPTTSAMTGKPLGNAARRLPRSSGLGQWATPGCTVRA